MLNGKYKLKDLIGNTPVYIKGPGYGSRIYFFICDIGSEKYWAVGPDNVSDATSIRRHYLRSTRFSGGFEIPENDWIENKNNVWCPVERISVVTCDK